MNVEEKNGLRLKDSCFSWSGFRFWYNSARKFVQTLFKSFELLSVRRREGWGEVVGEGGKGGKRRRKRERVLLFETFASASSWLLLEQVCEGNGEEPAHDLLYFLIISLVFSVIILSSFPRSFCENLLLNSPSLD